MASNYHSSLNRYRRYIETIRARPLWRATLYLALSLLLLIILLLTALRPTLVTIAKLVSDIQKQKELNAKLDAKIHQIQLAQQAYADKRVAPRLPLLDFGLPATSRFGLLAQAVLQMATDSALVTQNLAISPLQIKPEAENQVEFTLRADGTYPNIKKLIQRLENWRRLVNIEKVTLTSETNTDELTVDITGNAGYVYEEKPN